MEILLIFNAGASNKFWKIKAEENSYTITYGKIGTGGAVKTKTFGSAEICQKEAEKLIQSKLKKGYIPSEESEGIIKESAMIDKAFWDLLKWVKSKAEDSEEQIEYLIDYLSKLSVKDLIKFDSILNQYMNKSYTSDLWAAAYTILGGCSDECFDYFRAWLIFQGKDVYDNGNKDPESLIPFLIKMEELDDLPQLEDLLSAACMAFEEKTGHDDEAYYDLYEQLAGFEEQPELEFDWDEDDEEGMKKRFPKLWERYGEVPVEW
ncbi:DUF4240 domain-containing protein [Bacillus sp. OVS6]|nr:DUF4240 domain-containing protein [Bacillus sp. OVS6]